MTVSPLIVNQYYHAIFRVAPSSEDLSFCQAMPDDTTALNSMLSAARIGVDPVIRLYQAAFNRLPDNAGLTYWVNQYNSGAMSINEIANSFQVQPEFVAAYPASMSNAQYVNALYANILHRAGENTGVAYWIDQLDTGALTPAQVLYCFSESPEYKAAMQGRIDNFLTRIAETPLADQNNLALYSGSLFDFPDTYLTSYALTPLQDDVVVMREGLSLVKGIVGAPNHGNPEDATLTYGDTITGNGKTIVELTYAPSFHGGTAPYARMSGIDVLNIVSAAAIAVTFDASSYGTDISAVNVSGSAASDTSITNLTTSGEFTLTSAQNCSGTIEIGNSYFDTMGAMSVAPLSPNTDHDYWDHAISTSLYATGGTQANLFIHSIRDQNDSGGSAIRLLANEIQVSVGTDSETAVSDRDIAGVHVFHYAHASNNLVTAPQISIEAISLHVASGSQGEIAVSNRAENDGNRGSAEALGICAGAASIVQGAQSRAIIDIRNEASISTSGDTFGVKTSAHSDQIIVGDITAQAGAHADLTIDFEQLAFLGGQWSGAASVGNIEVGAIIALGVNAGVFKMSVNNSAWAFNASNTDTSMLDVGDITLSDVEVSGWDLVQISAMNAAIASPGMNVNETVGNLIAGNVSLHANEASFSLIQGLIPGTGDFSTLGMVKVGTIEVGDLVATGNTGSASVGLGNIGSSYGATATVGSILAGSMIVHAQTDASIIVGLTALAGNGQATAGSLTIDNMSVTAGSGGVIDVSSMAYAHSGNASVGNVTIGDVALAHAGGNAQASDHSMLASIEISAFATATHETVAASAGKVTIGDVIVDGGVTDHASHANAEFKITADAQGKAGAANLATLSDIAIGDVTLSAEGSGGLAALTLDIHAHVANDGNASVSNIALGNASMIADNGPVSDVNLSANVSGDGTATVTGIAIGSIFLESLSSPVKTMSIDVHANVGRNGYASITDFMIGDLTSKAFSSSANLDLSVHAEAGSVSHRLSDATLSHLTVGDLFVSSTQDNVKGSIGINASAWNGDGAVSDVTIGTITAVGGAKASLSVSVTASVATGTASIAGVTIGGISTQAGTDLASINVLIKAETTNSGDVSLSDVTVGDISALAERDAARAYVTISASAASHATPITAAGEALGAASIRNVTIGNVRAGETGTPSMTAAVGHDVISSVYVQAFGDRASVMDVVIGDISAQGDGDMDVNVQAVILADDPMKFVLTASLTLALPLPSLGSATISNVKLGDISAQLLNMQDQGTANITLTAFAFGYALEQTHDGDATLSDVTIGGVNAEAGRVDFESILSALMLSAGSAPHNALVDHVTLGDVALTANGTSAASNVLSLKIAAGAGGSAANPLSGDEALIDHVVIGDIALDQGSQGHGGDMKLVVSISSSGERFGDIGTVTLGHASLMANDEVTAKLLLHFGANAESTAGVDGDIQSITIGDVLLSGGHGVVETGLRDPHGSAAQPFGIVIGALDDIATVDIGNWTIKAGAGSVITNHGISILAGHMNSSIDGVTIGNVDLSLTGVSGTIDSHILLRTDRLVHRVSIGDVDIASHGGKVDAAITVSATNTTPLIGGHLGTMEVGALAVSAEGHGAQASIEAHFNAQSIGAIDFGDVTMNADGQSAVASVNITVVATGDAGDVTIGDLDFHAHGIKAAAEMTLGLSGALVSTGNTMTISDVNACVDGSSAEAHLFVMASGTQNSSITIGDIAATLSNSSSAEETAHFKVDVILGDGAPASEGITLGDISLSSLVNSEAGRLNSAKVSANMVLSAGSANIAVGDITVVGGVYADSGVDSAIGSGFSGTFTGSYTAMGGETIHFDQDLVIDLSYDQASDHWSIGNVSLNPSLHDFKIVNNGGNWEIHDVSSVNITCTCSSGSSGTFGSFTSCSSTNYDLRLGNISLSDGVLNIDWASTTGNVSGSGMTYTGTVDMAALGFRDASVKLAFDGVHHLINDGDAVSFKVSDTGLNNITFDPAQLQVLDNFQEFSNGPNSWFDATATGTITVGDIDYSGYRALQDAAFVHKSAALTSMNIDIFGDTLTVATHGLKTGDRLVYTGGHISDDVSAGPMAAGTVCYAIVVDPDTIKLAESEASAEAGIALNIFGESQSADFSFDVVKAVIIDVSAFKGAAEIITAQGSTAVTDNADVNAIVLTSAQRDQVTFVSDNQNGMPGSAYSGPDVLTGFVNDTDVVVFQSKVDMTGGSVTLASDVSYGAFQASAAAVGGTKNLYASVISSMEGGEMKYDTYVAWDTDGAGDAAGVTIVKLAGISTLATSDFTAGKFGWTLS